MADDSERSGPLAGLRVLDFTRVLSGPYSTMALADLGAEVVKIESPDGGDDTRHWGPPFVADQSTYFMSVNRNKKSVTVDLKTPEGLSAARALAETADIVVENFRPGVAARLGIGYDDLNARHPELIYASISGYGQDSSEAVRPGYDPIIQARSGLMSITGSIGGEPARVGVAISDISSSMWLTIGILAALHARSLTGRGQHVDVALYDSQVAWLTNVAGAWFAEGRDAERHGTGHPSIVPSAAYATADGEIMIAIGNDRMWRRLAEAVGAPQLGWDARYATNAARVAHREELRVDLEDALATVGTDEWIERLVAQGVPCARVNTIGQALGDPLLEERGMIVTTQHPTAGEVRSLGCPIRFSRDAATYRLPPPLLGEHTHEVLNPLVELAALPTHDQNRGQL